MKKLFSIVLFSVMLINLTGCAGNQIQKSTADAVNSNIPSSDATPSEPDSSMPHSGIDSSSGETESINGAKFEGQLPIVDEFVALDAVKLFLKLVDYEQVPNGSGGYTYRKENLELGGSGRYETKGDFELLGDFKLVGDVGFDANEATNKPFFLVSLIHWDEVMLAEGVHKPTTKKNYAVLMETGDIQEITLA